MASAFLLAAVGQAMFVSCTKQEADQIVTSPTKLMVQVNGIDAFNSSSEKKSSARTTPQSIQTNAKLLTFDEFDAQTILDNHVQTKVQSATVRNISNHSASSRTRAAAVDPGVKYRLFMYKDGVFVSSSPLEVGQPGEVDVVQGETYQWYALSYNSENNVPDIDPSDPSVDLAGGNDVLYASGEIEIPEGGAENPLAIAFKHKVSQIAVELNSMGMFGKFSPTATVSVSGLNVQTGSFNVLTGEWSNLSPYTQTIAWSDFEDIDPANGDRKVFVTYTASTDPVSGVSVGLSNFSIEHIDGVTRNFTTGGTFDFSDVTPVLGESHRLLANLVESPLTVTKGGTTARWARSNLYYTDAHNPYRFYGENKLNTATDGRGYFSFGGVIPRKFSTDGIQDPCALVYPLGVWRLPTNSEFATLTTSDGTLTNVMSNIFQLAVSAPAKNYDNTNATGDGTYIQYKVNAGGGNSAFDAASNALRFYYNGQVTKVSVLTDIGADGLVVLSLDDSHSEEVALWTNQGGLNVPILGLSAGSWGYHARDKRTIFGVDFIGAQGTAELLSNVDLLGIDAVSSTFKNCRCVRN